MKTKLTLKSAYLLVMLVCVWNVPVAFGQNTLAEKTQRLCKMWHFKATAMKGKSDEINQQVTQQGIEKANFVEFRQDGTLTMKFQDNLFDDNWTFNADASAILVPRGEITLTINKLTANELSLTMRTAQNTQELTLAYFSIAQTVATDKPSLLIKNIYTTDLVVNPKDTIYIKATGSIKLGIFYGWSSPAGIYGATEYRYIPDWNNGLLVAKVNNSVYPIGEGGGFIAKEKANLELLVNDMDLGNNQGNFEVFLFKNGRQVFPNKLQTESPELASERIKAQNQVAGQMLNILFNTNGSSGAGSGGDDEVRCSRCNGAGEEVVPVDNGMRYVRCGRCNGTGRVKR